jgi:hypothetical protein
MGVDRFELAMRDLVEALHRRTNERLAPFASMVQDAATGVAQGLADHAALRSMTHGVPAGYVIARTSDPSGFVRWGEIIGKPDWLTGTFDPGVLTFDASQITSGTIALDRLPPVVVLTNDPRLNVATITLPVGEPLSAGDMVTVVEDTGGTAVVMRASATSPTTVAIGYVVESYGINQQAQVYPVGINPYASPVTMTGIQIGTHVFLATTPGRITTTPPGGSGTVIQPVGRVVGVPTGSVVPVLIRYEYRIINQ